MFAAECFHFGADAINVDRFFRWPPVTTTARAPISISFNPAAFIPATSFTSMPVRNSASGMLGVMTVTRFSNSSRTNFRPEGVEQLGVPCCGAEDGIKHDVLERMLVEKFGDHGGVRAIGEHADFYAGEFHVIQKRIELRAQRGGGSGVDGEDALSGLNGERGDSGDAVAIVRDESF